MTKGYHREEYRGWEIRVCRSGRLGGYSGYGRVAGQDKETIATRTHLGPGAKKAAIAETKEKIDILLDGVKLR